MSFRALRRTLLSKNGAVLALDERRADVLVAIGARMARGERVMDEDLAAACNGSGPTAFKDAERLAKPVFVLTAGNSYTAIISFRGLVDYDLEFQPYAVSTRLFARTLREIAASSSVKSIVVVFSSPGGVVTGTPEAADAMFAARQVKKVTAIVDTMAASAAYWIASNASEIVCLPSGEGVGSIGVRMLHIDCSAMMKDAGLTPTFIYSGEFKVEGNAFEPLGDIARAHYQMESDAIYAGFLKAVARGRGVSVRDVREKFGKGRLVMPVEAMKIGMLDRLEETDDSFRRLGLISSGVAAPRTALEQKSLHQVFIEAAGLKPVAGSRFDQLRALRAALEIAALE